MAKKQSKGVQMNKLVINKEDLLQNVQKIKEGGS